MFNPAIRERFRIIELLRGMAEEARKAASNIPQSHPHSNAYREQVSHRTVAMALTMAADAVFMLPEHEVG